MPRLPGGAPAGEFHGDLRLYGRDDECQRIVDLLQRTRQGIGDGLVVNGDQGFGKTALLDYAAHAASGFRVLRAVGFESEAEFGFGALHRTVLALGGDRGRLPDRQRRALESVFGEGDAPRPDPFMVGLATLTLMSNAATRQPLLCIVDDAQWLDSDSLATLAFVARRLQADHIAMLFGVRPAEFQQSELLAGIPQIHIVGLAEAPARHLLASRTTDEVDPGVAQRIVTESQGCPLAIVEIAAALTRGQLAATQSLPVALPVGRALESHLLGRIRLLPEQTQRYLLLAAAEPSGERLLIEEAARSLDLPPDAAEPAAHAGWIIESASGVRFRHPLIRAAVYNGAGVADARAAHAALASAPRLEGDADRRAWHLASATLPPDVEVAQQLMSAAEVTKTRGGSLAAAALYLRACDFAPDPGMRGNCALEAAGALLWAGRPGSAHAVLDREAASLAHPYLGAIAAHLRAMAAFQMWREPNMIAPELVKTARQLQPFDIRAARGALVAAITAAILSTPRLNGQAGGLTEVARAARAMPLPTDLEATREDLLLDGAAALLLDGPSAGARALRRAIDALRSEATDPQEDLQLILLAGWVIGVLGDLKALRKVAGRVERYAREQGAAVALATTLSYRGWEEMTMGYLAPAQSHFAEATEVAGLIAPTPDPFSPVVFAWQGRESDTYTATEEVMRFARDRDNGWFTTWVAHARTTLELGYGRYEAALTAASTNYAHNPFISLLSFPDLVEAAAHAGDIGQAHDAYHTMAQRGSSHDTPFTRGLRARAKAMVSDGDEAEAAYRESVDLLTRSRGQAPLARTQLVYGEWLRRRRRRADAREVLRAAHTTFLGMGAAAFAERARVELAASGERLARSPEPVTPQLTPQELHVARLASMGATNPEIAERLYISSSTVDYHLRKVYRKLQVTSRRQLTRALAA